ncbi:MAG: DNA alkylation repair protein [bacterium]|nr:DNA alkylation repair protein [bacterium]
MASVAEVVRRLEAMARPDRVGGMARNGLTAERRLGVSVPEMRKLAREIGKDHRLALGLWRTGIPEARILASMVAIPWELTAEQMDEWAAGMNSWDVCDQACMNLFDRSPLAWRKIVEWSAREEEYVRRAAYALIACLACHDKGAADGKFIRLFPAIRRGAGDGRHYVKKAVSWAIRGIGKRNRNLRAAAAALAEEIGRMDSRAARWIAADAARELGSGAARRRLRVRGKGRP